MYGKKVRVEARYGDLDDPFFVTDALRVRVEQVANLADALAQTKVTIFNVSQATIRAFTQAQHTPTDSSPVPHTRIRVWAGYQDEGLSLLVEGVVMNTLPYRALPENRLELRVIPVASRMTQNTFTAVDTRASKVGVTLKQLIEQIGESSGFAPGEVRVLLPDAQAQQKVYEVSRPQGAQPLMTELQRLGKIYSFYVAYRAAGLGIYPYLDDTQAGLSAYNHLIDNNGDYQPLAVLPQLVQGTPIGGMMTLQLPLTLLPTVVPGSLLDTAPITSSHDHVGITNWDALGHPLYYQDGVTKYASLRYYMAAVVNHVADAFGESGADWMTTVTGQIPAAGPLGTNELRG